MTWGQPLGLDELMIVNPGVAGDENNLLLGEDGNLYQLQSDEIDMQGLGEFFLGDDGMLYQLQAYSVPEPSPFSRSLDRKCSRCGCGRRSRF